MNADTTSLPVSAAYETLPEGHCLHGIYESFLYLTVINFTCYPLYMKLQEKPHLLIWKYQLKYVEIN